MPIALILIGLAVLLIVGLLAFIISRYKRCPSDKLLVIYGKTGSGSAKCLAGGAAFVWPVIQDYQFLDLSPISIDVNLEGALSRQNIRVNVPSRFTVAISTQEGVMINAAERLLGKSNNEIREIAKDIIFGQLRLIVATMDIEEINSDRDKFLANVATNVGTELKKIGLILINVNVTDIQDESGYITALGKEAAAQAINAAKRVVAEKNRDGSIGEAEALQSQRIAVAEANAKAEIGEAHSRAEAENRAKKIIAEQNRDGEIGEAEAQRAQRIAVAEANAQARIGEAAAQAEATQGQNEAQIKIAQSNALRKEKEAEAERISLAAQKVQKAKTLEEAYAAEQKAEEARALRDLATKKADIIVKANIQKSKIEIDAEALAEETRRIAKGEADAIFLKKEAEARGLFEVMSKQAQGFKLMVEAAGGNAQDAILMLIADQLPELVEKQVEAIKNIKIDKVTVWDGGGGNGGGGSTADFISGMYKAVPPLNDLFNLAGMELPNYLGKEAQKKIELPESEDDLAV